MAGEQKGKAYEALAKVALEDIKGTGKIKGRIFWDERPDTMTIMPDLTIGRSSNDPDICLLITHTGSAKNSDMKFWRNMGELVEEKVFLPTPAKVFNLAFDSVFKENLKKVQAASFDGQLIVGDRSYGDDLQAWIDTNLKGFPKDKEEKVNHIRGLLKMDKDLKRLYTLFRKDMATLVTKKAPKELNGIWSMERKRKKGKAPIRKETFVRRGLSKLLIFEDLDIALKLFSGKRVDQKDVLSYAYELGLATKFSVGKSGIAKPADEEIVSAVNVLGAANVKAVLAKASIKKMEGWLVTLRNSPHLAFMGRYVADNYSDLCSPTALKHQLMALYRSPDALDGSYLLPANWPPSKVWILEYLIEIIKQDSGMAAGYGYAQLARDVADPKGAASSLRRDDANFLLSPWGHLSEWIHREPKGALPDAVIEGIALIMASRLSGIPVKSITANSVKIAAAVKQNVMESKLCTYSGFDPLRLLIEVAVPGGARTRLRSCFGERAGLTGSASKTTVIVADSTLINWQSASDAGRDHKKKELCGRAAALRYNWDPKAKRFIPRPGVNKLILVVDGTWRQSDLDALVRAGWDEIFYPDEMDKLAKAIV